MSIPTIFMTITSMSRNQWAMRSPASPARVRANPTNKANTMTCNIWPSAMALKGLLGNMLTIVSVRGGGGFASNAAAAIVATPLPGPINKATPSPSETATQVVNKYRPMVLPAIDPMRLLPPSELMPQISDTITSGTTNNFKEAIKMRPTTSKAPNTNPS